MWVIPRPHPLMPSAASLGFRLSEGLQPLPWAPKSNWLPGAFTLDRRLVLCQPVCKWAWTFKHTFFSATQGAGGGGQGSGMKALGPVLNELTSQQRRQETPCSGPCLGYSLGAGGRLGSACKNLKDTCPDLGENTLKEQTSIIRQMKEGYLEEGISIGGSSEVGRDLCRQPSATYVWSGMGPAVGKVEGPGKAGPRARAPSTASKGIWIFILWVPRCPQRVSHRRREGRVTL